MDRRTTIESTVTRREESLQRQEDFNEQAKAAEGVYKTIQRLFLAAETSTEKGNLAWDKQLRSTNADDQRLNQVIENHFGNDELSKMTASGRALALRTGYCVLLALTLEHRREQQQQANTSDRSAEVSLQDQAADRQTALMKQATELLNSKDQQNPTMAALMRVLSTIVWDFGDAQSVLAKTMSYWEQSRHQTKPATAPGPALQSQSSIDG